ncbi:hypothetical protein H8958_006244 [Nasalis larvatus]
MPCHLCSTHTLAGKGLGVGGGSEVEIADGELGSGDGNGEERKRAWRKGCRICSEEPPNQRAQKISLGESLQQQLILSSQTSQVAETSVGCVTLPASAPAPQLSPEPLDQGRKRSGGWPRTLSGAQLQPGRIGPEPTKGSSLLQASTTSQPGRQLERNQRQMRPWTRQGELRPSRPWGCFLLGSDRVFCACGMEAQLAWAPGCPSAPLSKQPSGAGEVSHCGLRVMAKEEKQ